MTDLPDKLKTGINAVKILSVLYLCFVWMGQSSQRLSGMSQFLQRFTSLCRDWLASSI